MNLPRLALLTLVSLAAITDGFATETFRFRRPLLVPERHQEQLAAVRFDSQLYAALRPDLTDLRLQVRGGAELPFLIERLTQRQQQDYYQLSPAAITALEQTQPSTIVLTVRVPKQLGEVSAVQLQTPLHNFCKQVTVRTKLNDTDEWQLVADAAIVYDYSQFADVRNTLVPFTPVAARLLQVVIAEARDTMQSPFMTLQREFTDGQQDREIQAVRVLDRAFRVDAVQVGCSATRVSAAAPVEQVYAVQFAVISPPDASVTELRIDTQQQPLTGFRLAFASRNFHRSVRVLTEDGRQLAQQAIFALNYHDFQRQELLVKFPPSQASSYRLRIANADNPPLVPTGVEAVGLVHRLIFLAEPAATYQLCYGNAAAARPQYDTSTITDLMGQGFAVTQAALGEPEQVGAPGPNLQAIVSSKPFFIGVVISVVAALAYALYAAARKLPDAS